MYTFRKSLQTLWLKLKASKPSVHLWKIIANLLTQVGRKQTKCTPLENHWHLSDSSRKRASLLTQVGHKQTKQFALTAQNITDPGVSAITIQVLAIITVNSIYYNQEYTENTTTIAAGWSRISFKSSRWSSIFWWGSSWPRKCFAIFCFTTLWKLSQTLAKESQVVWDHLCCLLVCCNSFGYTSFHDCLWQCLPPWQTSPSFWLLEEPC